MYWVFNSVGSNTIKMHLCCTEFNDSSGQNAIRRFSDPLVKSKRMPMIPDTENISVKNSDSVSNTMNNQNHDWKAR